MLFQLVGQFGTAGGHNLAVGEHVHEIGFHIVEDPLVVGNHDDPTTGFFLIVVNTLGNNAERIHVQPRVGLIHDRKFWFQQIQLQHFVPFLLTPGEAFVDGPFRECFVNVQPVLGFFYFFHPFPEFRGFPPHRGGGATQEVRH